MPVPFATRTSAWLTRWQPILPLFLAEFVVWLGFGAFLPVLPLYLTSQGIDFATLGLIVAAWPAARLVAEPVFGWIADRTARKPIMVASLLVNAVVIPLPLLVSGAGAFVVLRALAGLATAAYDPAARGYLVDATPRERQGEAFGLYGAAQMGGLLFGPALGALFAALVGNEQVVFLLASVGSGLAGLILAATVRERRRIPAHTGIPAEGVAELRGAGPNPSGGPGRTDDAGSGEDRPSSLANRLLIAALVINAGGAVGQGTYEVIWSLFLTSLGAGLGLVGATFATFGLPILLFSPIAGRYVDRRGSLPFIVIGTLMVGFCGIAYTIIRDPLLAVPLVFIEASGFAISFPALYAVVAAGSPAGRSSTAQGLFGAAGTVGFIVSSLVAGRLAAADIRLPFWFFVVTMLTTLVIGLAIGGRRIAAMGRFAPSGEPAPTDAEVVRAADV
jgi:MFS family permease